MHSPSIPVSTPLNSTVQQSKYASWNDQVKLRHIMLACFSPQQLYQKISTSSGLLLLFLNAKPEHFDDCYMNTNISLEFYGHIKWYIIFSTHQISIIHLMKPIIPQSMCGMRYLAHYETTGSLWLCKLSQIF